MLREEAEGVRALARGKPLYYTEWNSSSNPRDPMHDEPYAAAFAIKTDLEAARLVEGTAIGPFRIFLRKIIFRQCRSTEVSACLTCTASQNPFTGLINYCTDSAIKQMPVAGAHATVDTWVVKDGNEAAAKTAIRTTMDSRCCARIGVCRGIRSQVSGFVYS